MDNAPSKLQTWIKSEGRRKGWLAGQMRVAPSTLTQWVKGRRVPQAIHRERLETITGGAVPAAMWEGET